MKKVKNKTILKIIFLSLLTNQFLLTNLKSNAMNNDDNQYFPKVEIIIKKTKNSSNSFLNKKTKYLDNNSIKTNTKKIKKPELNKELPSVKPELNKELLESKFKEINNKFKYENYNKNKNLKNLIFDLTNYFLKNQIPSSDIEIVKNNILRYFLKKIEIFEKIIKRYSNEKIYDLEQIKISYLSKYEFLEYRSTILYQFNKEFENLYKTPIFNNDQIEELLCLEDIANLFSSLNIPSYSKKTNLITKPVTYILPLIEAVLDKLDIKLNCSKLNPKTICLNKDIMLLIKEISCLLLPDIRKTLIIATNNNLNKNDSILKSDITEYLRIKNRINLINSKLN